MSKFNLRLSTTLKLTAKFLIMNAGTGSTGHVVNASFLVLHDQRRVLISQSVNLLRCLGLRVTQNSHLPANHEHFVITNELNFDTKPVQTNIFVKMFTLLSQKFIQTHGLAKFTFK